MNDRDDIATFGVGATLGWALLVFLLAQALGVVAMMALPGETPDSVAAARHDGRLIALVTLVTNPFQILALMMIARRAPGGALAYLGLVGFRRRHLIVSVMVLGSIVAAVDLFAYAAGFDVVSPFQIDAYASARRTGWLIPLALAVIVVAPIGEEIVFRGFLFRGLVRPGPRGIVAVLAITLLWAGLHAQYDLFGMIQVFLIGLALAWVRWISGSTTLVILLHAMANAVGTIETFVRLGSFP